MTTPLTIQSNHTLSTRRKSHQLHVEMSDSSEEHSRSLQKDLQSSILNLILDHADESALKLDRVTTLQKECSFELEKLKADVDGCLRNNDTIELVATIVHMVDETISFAESMKDKLALIDDMISSVECNYALELKPIAELTP